MKILKVFDQAELVLVDLEVNLGNKTQSSPTLCIKMDGKIGFEYDFDIKNTCFSHKTEYLLKN